MAILIKKGSQDLSGGPVADSVLSKQRACLGSVCGQGTRPPHAATESLHATMKTEDPSCCN